MIKNDINEDNLKAKDESKLTDFEIISECKKDLASWIDFHDTANKQYEKRMKFSFGEQWDSKVKENYESQHRPTLVIDQINPYVKKILGLQKQSDVEITIIPNNEESSQENLQQETKDSLELLSGLMSKINYDNEAKRQYSLLTKKVLIGGFGVLKVLTEYENETSFNQKIKIEASVNPRSAFFDPDATDMQRVNGNFCGEYEILGVKEFKALYPNAKNTNTSIFTENSLLDNKSTGDNTVICMYYKRRFVPATIVQLSNKQDYTVTVLKDKIEEAQQQYFEQQESQGKPLPEILPLEETNRRETHLSKIYWYKLSGDEILARGEWMSKKLSFLYITADAEVIDKTYKTKSFIDSAIDPQRLYNYSMSEIAYGLNTSNKEKFMLTDAEVKGHEDDYKNPQSVQGYLGFNPDPRMGNMRPGPLPAPEVSQSFFLTADRSGNDIIKCLGMIDPTTGKGPKPESGIALSRSFYQQNLGVVDFIDSIEAGMEMGGKIILDLIPKIYDSERVVSIFDKDRQVQRKKINAVDDMGKQVNDISQIFQNVDDVEIKADSSFAQQKEDVLTLLVEILKLPQVAPLILDLLPKFIDSPFSMELQKRLKYAVPPYVIENKPPPPPQPQNDPEMMLKQAELQQKMKESQYKMQASTEKSQTDQEKIGLEKEKLINDINKIIIESNTELEAANINRETELAKAYASATKEKQVIRDIKD